MSSIYLRLTILVCLVFDEQELAGLSVASAVSEVLRLPVNESVLR